jgi:ABC-2 type transport system ATP-binding protein
VRRGRVVYEGALDELLATAAGRYELRTTDDAFAADIARRQPEIRELCQDDRGLTFAADEDTATRLSVALGQAGVGIRALVPRTATLEELFFRFTEGASEPEPEPALEGAA